MEAFLPGEGLGSLHGFYTKGGHEGYKSIHDHRDFIGFIVFYFLIQKFRWHIRSFPAVNIPD